MLDAPAVLMIFTNEHNAGLHAISVAAAASFGPLVRTLSDELVAAAGYEWTSLVQLGDTARHCHFMLVGRPAGDTPILDAKLLMQRAAEREDPVKTRALADQLRVRMSKTSR
jgi:diadenosine tetraphosphate (Ap4A) HIT family hydrolase